MKKMLMLALIAVLGLTASATAKADCCPSGAACCEGRRLLPAG